MLKVTVFQTCDRCQKPFTQKHLEAGQTVPQVERTGLTITEQVNGESKVFLAYEDLCPKCRESVKNYLNRLTLQPQGQVKKDEAATAPAPVQAPASVPAPVQEPAVVETPL